MKLICGNCIDEMQKMKEQNIKVDLTVTSPPYDNLRTYGGTCNWNFDIFKSVANLLYDITDNGGVIVWIVSDSVIKGSESCTSFQQAIYFKEIGFNLHDTMIWQKTNPMPKVKTKRYFDVFEYMFIFSKGQPKTFNPIMVDCKLGGKTYNSTAKNIGGENGRTHKTFILNNKRYKNNIWEIAIAQNKTGRPAVFPEQLANDHIISWSDEGDTVFDPFMGSGTTGKMAILNNRNFIGIELVEEYFNIAKERIDKAIKQDKNNANNSLQ